MGLERNGGVYQIHKSKVPEDFPQGTLGQLWCLFDPGHTGRGSCVEQQEISACLQFRRGGNANKDRQKWMSNGDQGDVA